MENKFYVYVLKDDVGQIFYVGKGCRYRNSSHRHNAKQNRQEPVYNKIRKLWKSGKDYTFEKIKENLTQQESCELEKHLINVYKRKIDGGILFNITLGGESSFGYKHSSQTKEKLKTAWVKRKQIYVMSEETKRKISEAGKKRKIPDEVKKKISESISGSKHWNYGNKGPSKATLKMNEVAKKKVSVDGVIFDSVSEAAKHYGVSIPTVVYRAKNGKNRGGKYGIWKYV